jgi:hypothetical protein
MKNKYLVELVVPLLGFALVLGCSAVDVHAQTGAPPAFFIAPSWSSGNSLTSAGRALSAERRSSREQRVCHKVGYAESDAWREDADLTR